MWWPSETAHKRFAVWRFLLPILPLLQALSGCGYGLAGDSPSVLGKTRGSLYLSSLEQPTLFPWVSHTLRSALRDEITARNLAVWTENAREADFQMSLRVEQFTMRGAVKSSTDVNLLYTGSVSVTAIVHSTKDHREIWRTKASYSDTFESDAEESAGIMLFRQAARVIAQKMRQAF